MQHKLFLYTIAHSHNWYRLQKQYSCFNKKFNVLYAFFVMMLDARYDVHVAETHRDVNGTDNFRFESASASVSEDMV